ncbi:MAG: hypothetical protein SFV51_18035 [Bryobacteraceae bacterium]|nr:hypothetical protein [Bryobacteraceae bacterium]
MPSQPGSVTLLHLSDTQFGRNHRFGNLGVTAEDGKYDTLLARLKLDLDGLNEEHGVVPQAIIVSGDIAEWGMKSEFDDARRFRDGLSAHLNVPRAKPAKPISPNATAMKSCPSHPTGPSGNITPLCSPSSMANPDRRSARSSFRYWSPSRTYRCDFLGFRVAKDIT